MEKKIAVVICNYNKQEYVLKCINSVINSSLYKWIDIYIVDNASIDDSVKLIQENYGTQVNLIINKENKGGSGGFNTGIRKALEKSYKYIHLLDNDVILHENAIEELYKLMQAYNDIAMAGSKLLSMDCPNEIQELGAAINWNEGSIQPYYKGCMDNNDFAKLIECDYIPACSMMVRVNVIREIGLMNEENFIYWDDIDWCYRAKLAGYRVLAHGQSKAWHKMGVKQHKNTFATYYFWRNRISFFIKYISEDSLYKWCSKIFEEVFQAIYTCKYSNKINTATTILWAVDDALNNVQGKARNNRILIIEKVENAIEKLLKDEKQIYISYNDSLKDIKIVNKVIKAILNRKKDIKINLLTTNRDLMLLTNQYNQVQIIKKFDKNDIYLIFKVSSHVFEQEESNYEKDYIIIDRFLNVIDSREDKNHLKRYNESYLLYRDLYYPLFINKVFELKDKIGYEYCNKL